METELSGSLAMIHPRLSNDPGLRQGQIGLIVDADLAKDDIYVGFGKDRVVLYSSNALMVLQKPHDINGNALQNRFELPAADFKALLQIGLWQQSGKAENMKNALELGASNDNLLKYSMTTLKDKLGIAARQTQDIAPERETVRSR
jgi:hypothetical protein